MQLEVRNYDLDTSEPTVLLHEDDCRILSVSDSYTRTTAASCRSARGTASESPGRQRR